MKGYIGKMVALAAMVGGFPEIKLSPSDKRELKYKRKNQPPRSMTQAEQEYFAIHKHLNGFKQ